MSMKLPYGFWMKTIANELKQFINRIENVDAGQLKFNVRT